MFKYLVSQIILSSLKKGFRRICWVGPLPDFPENLPVVAYANHHTFYDGYVMWLLGQELLGRESILWMEEWHRFPFFAAVGAYPFPADDKLRRLTTIRQTTKRMVQDPNAYLIYFPEGKLHAPETGILPISKNNLSRLDRILPDKYWWPVSIHLTNWGETRPTLLLTGGEPHRLSTGEEAAALQQGIDFLQSTQHPCSQTLLEGKKSDDEAWDMRFMARWFERYL